MAPVPAGDGASGTGAASGTPGPSQADRLSESMDSDRHCGKGESCPAFLLVVTYRAPFKNALLRAVREQGSLVLRVSTQTRRRQQRDSLKIEVRNLGDAGKGICDASLSLSLGTKNRNG